jgi:hypothetical protein
MLNIDFTHRWREELVAKSEAGTLIFEVTMGSYHVYFPTEETWLKSTPEWAKPQWNDFYEACHAWCRSNHIPITVVENALVYEERTK